MPRLIEGPSVIESAGQPPKRIEELFGRINSEDEGVSIAVMTAPLGWVEPGQCPDFDEYTVVLDGMLEVEHDAGTIEVGPGQAVLARKGEWVRYSAPDGARYVSICLPAFSPATVHRDPE